MEYRIVPHPFLISGKKFDTEKEANAYGEKKLEHPLVTSVSILKCEVVATLGEIKVVKTRRRRNKK